MGFWARASLWWGSDCSVPIAIGPESLGEADRFLVTGRSSPLAPGAPTSKASELGTRHFLFLQRD
jgi:hypothetical protein